MELLFYHLQAAPLEAVLPNLLQKSLDKGWRAIVETNSIERVEHIDTMLWTFADDSFLAHSAFIKGKNTDLNLQAQPILVTNEETNPNGAQIRFFVDSGDVTAHSDYERLVYIFTGHDEQAVARARAQWSAAVNNKMPATYWQQSDRGRWEKKA